MDNTHDFATKEDLASFWRTLTDNEPARADILLNMSSNYLRQVAKNNDKDIDALIVADTTNIFKENVKMVVLASVKRAMTTPADAPPANEWSQSASPYSETMKFTNPSSDLFFKANELKLLGIASVSGKGQFGILRGVR
jgi:hypothetical protein